MFWASIFFISGIKKLEGLSKYHVLEKRSSAHAESKFKKKFKIKVKLEQVRWVSRISPIEIKKLWKFLWFNEKNINQWNHKIYQFTKIISQGDDFAVELLRITIILTLRRHFRFYFFSFNTYFLSYNKVDSISISAFC